MACAEVGHDPRALIGKRSTRVVLVWTMTICRQKGVAFSYGFHEGVRRWRPKQQLRCGEAFHHQHRSAALGTLPQAVRLDRRLSPCIQPRFRRGVCCDQLPTQRQQRAAVARAEKAKVADTHEALWQDMQQEAPEELLDGQESSGASCSCEPSRASGRSPCRQPRRRAGGLRLRPGACSRRDIAAHARRRRTAVCNRRPSRCGKCDGARGEDAWACQRADYRGKLSLPLRNAFLSASRRICRGRLS